MQEFMTAAITLILSNMTVTLFVVGLISAAIISLASRHRHEPGFVSGAFLNQFLLLSVGVAYAYNFLMHSVFGDFTAKIIGWAQSPFQLEVAFASLGFALVGFVAFSRRRSLMVKFVALLGPAVFLWGDAGGHIYQIATTGNTAAGNAGSILYSDILLPFIGFALLWWHGAATRRHETASVRDPEAWSEATS
ncbi:DUF6790 family protein [Humibacter sp.]|uniref:DUF6790 family protein n=1 Tax=Humibacter sp. TaxID=1940291 RepID=UPI003F7F43F3